MRLPASAPAVVCCAPSCQSCRGVWRARRRRGRRAAQTCVGGVSAACCTGLAVRKRHMPPRAPPVRRLRARKLPTRPWWGRGALAGTGASGGRCCAGHGCLIFHVCFACEVPDRGSVLRVLCEGTQAAARKRAVRRNVLQL